MQMMRVFRCVALWLNLLLLLPATYAAPTAIPSLNEPVIDQAQILTTGTRQQLNRILYSLRQQGGSQIAILTIPSLSEDTIESYAIRVVEQWQLGDQGKDNGVLFVISNEDRQIRIEVGRGLEGVLPDIHASRIVRNQITPLFKQGEFDRGVAVGIAAIIGLTDPEFSLAALATSRTTQRSRQRSENPGIIFWFLILPLLMLLSMISKTRSGLRRYSSRRGYWGGIGPMSGGFGGGRGGFGGGGGGFSGGGASGGW